MPLDRFAHRSGRWDDEEREKPASRILKLILQRSWILIVPLIAIAWYNSRQIVPLSKKYDADLATAKKTAEARRTTVLSDARRVGVQISALNALSDTLEVRFQKYDALIDSVSVLRDADMVEVQSLEHQADSLRAIYSQAAGKSGDLSVLLPPMQARIDSLKIRISAREDSIQALQAQKQTDLALAERILRPQLFRKNSAILTGAGTFPNRDSLPKR
jgi:hypothetical protein